jgi:hypothetical protein
MGIRLGSWGTPELGITEFVGGLLGKQRDVTTGGSQLSGTPLTNNFVSTQSPTNAFAGNLTPAARGGSTLGISTTGSGGGGQQNPVQQQTQQQSNPYAGMEENAKSQAQLELEQALSEFDYYAEQAQGQRANLGGERERALGTLGTDLGRAQTQAKTAKEEATGATQTAKNKALGTAQDVQKGNRNVLRALGILSSSAAGEMLNKPMNEYGTQAADLEQNLIKRQDVITNWLGERIQDHDAASKEIEAKYADLTGKIDSDLRFNDRQRQTAVKSASAALQQRLQEIEASKVQYQQAAQQYNNNILAQIAQLKMYQNPNADVSGILGTMLGSVSTGNTSNTELSNFQKKKNTLSG